MRSEARPHPLAFAPPPRPGAPPESATGRGAPSLVQSAPAAPAEPTAVPAAALDDAALTARILAGERQCFEPLLQRHERAVFFHLRRMMKNQEEAEDLTQETFLLVFRKLMLYDPTLPFRPWVLRIATHAALSRLRRRSLATVSLDAVDTPLDLPDPMAARLPAQLDAADALTRLDAAVAQLPPELATLFHLRYREELRVDAIAAVFKRKPGAVAVALHRLREKLRAVVFPDDQGAKP
jgi:RNA polymerase sigma factor (sigma-70 family)